MSRRGMGRGLAAILPAESELGEIGLRSVAVELIAPNPDQPRRRFESGSLEGLAASIREAGVIQPLVVRPLGDGRYELIAGERRWRAAQLAGLAEVPAILRSEGEATRLQTALIENVAREDLNPVDEARACSLLIDDLGITKEELAKRLGRSRSAISNLVRILELPDEALELIAAGSLTEGHGRAILAAGDHDARRRLAREAAARDWSVRETERRARGGTARRYRSPARTPDEQDAITQAEEALEGALGRGVKVSPARSGVRVELHFADLDELLGFASHRSH
ncbi:MAG: ParB/RepB/Spo0J family partition protein [Solirubrobacterales bacterium]|nr:ParB/RepB/Spo0J family partition protein [Solirubrobacterales bacterium]